jgi:hypothetical protein
MKVFTYSETRKRLAMVLDIARTEEVLIKRRGGEVFSLRAAAASKSPFDVPGVSTRVTMADILAAIDESRAHDALPQAAANR